MTDLIGYFKGKPKTGLIILTVAVLLTVAWQLNKAPRPLTSQGGSGVASPTADYYAYEQASGAPGVSGKSFALSIAASPPAIYDERGGYFEPNPTAGQNAAEVDQKIIKNGYLRMVVLKVSDSVADISALATTRGGYVQNSSVTERGDGSYSGEVSVRVPVAKYEETMTAIKKLSVVVKHENSTGQDVTEQYSDLEAQIRNAKAQEETYLAVLKQAKSVEDILRVQERLGSIRSLIESLEGRLKYLENSTSFSTITVSLEEEANVRAPTKEFRLGAIVKNAVQTLVGAAQNVVAGLIYTVIVWGGILLPLGLLAWIIWKVWKRKSRR